MSRHPVVSHLSSLQRRTRLWELGDITAAAVPGSRPVGSRRWEGFSGVSRRRSCRSSCSYICLCRSRAQRFSSSCCLSRVCNTDCKGSEEEEEEPPEDGWMEEGRGGKRGGVSVKKFLFHYSFLSNENVINL